STQMGVAMETHLARLAADKDIDGLLAARVDQAAAAATGGGGTAAEPRVLAWDLDLPSAARFGRTGGDSGLAGPNPGPGHVVINAPLAKSLRVRAGEPVTLYIYGQPRTFTV